MLMSCYYYHYDYDNHDVNFLINTLLIGIVIKLKHHILSTPSIYYQRDHKHIKNKIPKKTATQLPPNL